MGRAPGSALSGTVRVGLFEHFDWREIASKRSVEMPARARWPHPTSWGYSTFAQTSRRAPIEGPRSRVQAACFAAPRRAARRERPPDPPRPRAFAVILTFKWPASHTPPKRGRRQKYDVRPHGCEG
jgi:hypothetical protein